MIKSIKIRLFPTEEQEIIMRKSVGVSRFAYNWGLARWNELHDKGEKVSKVIVRTEFNAMKKQEEYKWLYEVSGQISVKSFDDLETAFKNFFKGIARHPKFKSKKKAKQSFYVRYDYIKFLDGKVNMEKIGKVKYKSNYDIPNLPKYVNPRCSFDGKHWCLSLGYEQEQPVNELTEEVIGIDVGIKDLAICSNGMVFKNINKTKTVKKTEKRLRRLQRKVSRKYEMNKQGDKFVKTNNVIKLERQIKLVYRRLKNIRTNHLHQATNKIVKTKPSKVVMETLNIQGMMKNKHLSKAIAQQRLYEFKRQMQYKCKWNGIEFVEADKWYPSSKTCSQCGHIKKDLKLSDRVYKCSECGAVIDRDLNASINLSKYTA